MYLAKCDRNADRKAQEPSHLHGAAEERGEQLAAGVIEKHQVTPVFAHQR